MTDNQKKEFNAVSPIASAMGADYNEYRKAAGDAGRRRAAEAEKASRDLLRNFPRVG